MGINGNYQISQTFPVGKLSEHHGKQLVPAGKMFYISISVIFIDYCIKNTLWKKLN
jgi:hypothetical protein